MEASKRHPLVDSSGLTQEMFASIGAVALLASHTEMLVEKAIWAIEGRQKTSKGAVWTDTQQISGLIHKLAVLGKGTTPAIAEVIALWCQAAQLGFNCRNSIFHGRTFAGFGSAEWAVFARNMRIDGEPRLRPPSEFHASENTLDLLEESFGHLLNGIHVIGVAASAPNLPLGDTADVLKDLRRARSTLAEIDDLAAAVNHEKY